MRLPKILMSVVGPRLVMPQSYVIYNVQGKFGAMVPEKQLVPYGHKNYNLDGLGHPVSG